jgi:hypothetical protein
LPSLPEPLVFFIDRGLGQIVVAAALKGAGQIVKTHDEIFPQDEHDSVWLKEVGRRGWIVLTKDTRIRYRVNEVTALRRAKVRAFVLTRGDLKGEEMGNIFVKALPAIRQLATSTAPPFIAHVSRDGSVRLVQGGAKND